MAFPWPGCALIRSEGSKLALGVVCANCVTTLDNAARGEAAAPCCNAWSLGVPESIISGSLPPSYLALAMNPSMKVESGCPVLKPPGVLAAPARDFRAALGGHCIRKGEGLEFPACMLPKVRNLNECIEYTTPAISTITEVNAGIINAVLCHHRPG